MSEQNERDLNRTRLLEVTTQVVSAYVSKNVVPSDDLPNLIRSVAASLAAGSAAPDEPEEPQQPAVSIRSSVKPDHLVCLECGKPMTMLKRHLNSDHELTPAEYRAKWSLPSDYPMAAPNYAQKRAEMAKSIGLGRRGATTPDTQA